MVIDSANVAVATVLVASSLNMLLWLTFCAFHNFRKPFELILVTPNQFPDVCKFENVVVAKVLCVS